MTKRTKIAEVVTDLEKGTITFDFAGCDGHEIVVPAKLSPDLRRKLMFHGLVQKLRDSYAGADDGKMGHDQFMPVLNSLRNGIWGRVKGAGAVSSLASVVATVMAISEKEAADKIAKLSADKRKVLRKDPRVMFRMEQMKAERAAAKAEGLVIAAEAEHDKLI